MSLNIQSKKYNVTASISFHDLLSKFIPRSDSASLVCKDRGEHTIKPLEQFPSDRWDQGEDVRPSIMHSGTFGENQTLRISTNSHRDQSQHRLNLSEICGATWAVHEWKHRRRVGQNYSTGMWETDKSHNAASGGSTNYWMKGCD